MNFIALKMLVGDRAKYIGIIIGLTFASLLITQQAEEHTPRQGRETTGILHGNSSANQR